MNDDKIEQPEAKQIGMVKGTRARAGSKKSVARLGELEYDPIEELVTQKARLEKEDKYWCDVRDRKITHMDSEGKIRTPRYNGQIHGTVLTLLNKTAVDLLRYQYGRVPETVNVNAHVLPGMEIKMPGYEPKHINRMPDEEVIEGEAVEVVTEFAHAQNIKVDTSKGNLRVYEPEVDKAEVERRRLASIAIEKSGRPA